MKELAKGFLILEGAGSYENAARFIEGYGQMDEITKETIEKLKDIPVDIERIFTFKF